jgi:amino-acid N-acetyltransferase
MATTVRAAQAADYAEVLTLLKQAGLPSDGVQESFANFLVARDAEDDLIGCVGAEYHGELALLRSLAVSEAARGKGLGRELVLEVLSTARAQQMREVVLLTATAEKFFAGFFGFEMVARNQYDEKLFASLEWHLTQCATAVCMRLPLA